VLIWLVLCCRRTAKRLEVAGWFGQYSLSLLCFAVVTVSLLGNLLHLYETSVQFS
jgi:hypothetical protein